MPPVLADRVAHEHAHLLSSYQVAERDGVLARFGAVGGVVVDVASVAPDSHPFIASIAAGVLTAATEALHLGADKVDAPLCGKQTVSGFHQNPPIKQREAVCVGDVIENFARLRIVYATHDEVRVGREPVGALCSNGQGNRTNDRPARSSNSAKVSSRHVHLGQSEAVPVSVDQAIEVSVLDQVGIDHCDLLEPSARETFEDDRTDAARSDDANVSASEACLYVDAPTVDGAYETWTASVGRVRARSAIRSSAARPNASNVRTVGGRDFAKAGFVPEASAPDAVRAHGQAEQRQAGLSNER